MEIASPAPSPLLRMCLWLEGLRPFRLSFEDLTGVSYDVPELNLDDAHRMHTAHLCALAKKSAGLNGGCGSSKALANRAVLRAGEGVCGRCHMGLTDIAEPLVYRGRILGVFYYGSVVTVETEEDARRMLLRRCELRHVPAGPLMQAFEAAPRATAAEVQGAREDVRALAQMAAHILQALGLPMDSYRTQNRARLAQEHRALPPLVRKALRVMALRYAEPLSLADIAGAVRCHPQHLTRVFRRHAGATVMETLQRIRIEHARRLLRLSQYNITQIAYETGFQDKSHFTRTFTRLVGKRPSQEKRESGV
ncbi:hypothetical protein DB346_20965 [Verrucomicrobia bacterium LW23]|nr:hypothetical protein DB346_20965 [Verrucomicrobia bacterium LW23]